MKKLALVLALVMALLCVFTACGEKESGGLTINSENNVSSSTQIVSGLLDGESFTLPKNITKVVSISPTVSLIFESIGASSKLIAVDTVSAGLLSAAPSVTTVSDAAALAPEVIFVDEADRDAIGETDIPVFTIPTAKSSDAVKKLIRVCGKVAGVDTSSVESKLTNSLNAAQLGSSAYTEKLTAYLDLGDGTVGSGTYHTEILYAAGLVNICTAEGFAKMTDDEIIAANPEFIFTVGDVEDYLGNAAFAEVSAVVNGFVYKIEEKDICYASNNIGNAVSAMYASVSGTRTDE